MTEFDSFKDANRQLWNSWTGLHQSSEFYNVEGFRQGKLSLRPVEMQELAPLVKDRAGNISLLHLMCHFGLDTLSWARLGARVTGTDISDDAMALARRLSEELNIPARFIQSDVYHLPEVLEGQFDIVFTSYGILHWLPDLRGWARVIAHFLKPGGVFYIVEDHPFMRVFDADSTDELHVDNPYFFEENPYEFEAKGSYASQSDEAPTVRGYMWDHSFSEILNALIAAGLRIEAVHEHPFAMRQKFPLMQQREDGLWYLGKQDGMVPLLFSLTARK